MLKKKVRQLMLSNLIFVQKKTIVQEGERNDGPPPATIATSEGGVTQFGELRDASCTLGSNEIH